MDTNKEFTHAEVSCLRGKRIVLTRPIHQARSWARNLTKLGARPVLYPVIAIVAPQDTNPLREALAHLTAEKFDWLVFSSANAVVATGQMLAELNSCVIPAKGRKKIALEKRHNAVNALPDGVRIAAVGPATAAAVEKEWGRRVDFIAPQPSGACLGRTLPLRPHDSVLLPQALQARPHLAEILARRSGALHVVTAYRTIPCRPEQDLRKVLRYPRAGCVCFASPSSVNAFLDLLSLDERVGLLADLDIVCLGNVTAQAAQQRELHVHVRCDNVTFSALLQALRQWYE